MLRFIGSQRVGHGRATELSAHTHTHTHTHTHRQTKVTLWGFGIQVGDWKLGGAHSQGGGLPW